MNTQDFFTWGIDPIIFTLGPLSIRWYGLFFATGFLIGFQLMKKIFIREGKDVEQLDGLLITMIAGTVIGARLGHCFFYEPSYYLSHPLTIFKVWEGGLASHGGAIGIIIACYFYMRKKKDFTLIWILDRLSIPVILGGAFIRLGNFFNSEIIGTKSSSSFAIIFERIDAVPRHPVQLYESISYFIIFAILLAVYQTLGLKKRDGLLLGIMLTLVFTMRFILEFVKTAQASYAQSLSLSVGQLLSIPCVIAGVIIILWSLMRKKQSEA